MLSVSRVLVRDHVTRTLLFVVDAATMPLRIEATKQALWIEEAGSGRPVVDAPTAHLELLNDEAIQFTGAARLHGEHDLQLVRLTLELAPG
ncbi:MAG: hypothetical protein KQH57_06400 [Actinomycetales bacterium]|nr:hypothetical protein [Actinomycetales bacterium]